MTRKPAHSEQPTAGVPAQARAGGDDLQDQSPHGTARMQHPGCSRSSLLFYARRVTLRDGKDSDHPFQGMRLASVLVGKETDRGAAIGNAQDGSTSTPSCPVTGTFEYVRRPSQKRSFVRFAAVAITSYPR